MTVAELIEKLTHFPQSLPVLVDDTEWPCIDYAEIHQVFTMTIDNNQIAVIR